jgi:hypothetical protein
VTQKINFIQRALNEVGYIEGPGVNETKYYLNNVPWCGAFVNWVAKKSKVRIPNCLFTPAGANAFKKADRWYPVKTAKPIMGDLAFFDFPADGIDRISHVGIVIADNGDGTILTVEGNTSPDIKGDQRNGGEVCVKVRAYKKTNDRKLPVSIVGFGRPKFKER